MPHSRPQNPSPDLCRPETTEDAMTTLGGILRGMAFDGILTAGERSVLEQWIAGHRHLMQEHPFREIIPQVALLADCKDGILPPEDVRELLYLCRRFGRHRQLHDAAGKDLRELHGILYGIAADGVVTEIELDGLGAWMRKHPHLHPHWPHAEVMDILHKKRQNQPFTPSETAFLLCFCADIAPLAS